MLINSFSHQRTTCFAILLQNDLNSDVAHFNYHSCSQLDCSKTGLMWVVKCAMTLFNSFCSNVAKQVACILLPPFLYLKIQPRVSELCDTFRDGKTSRLHWEMKNNYLWQWLQLNFSANNVNCVNYYPKVGGNERQERSIWKVKLFKWCTNPILPFSFLLTKYHFLCAYRLKFFLFFYVESLGRFFVKIWRLQSVKNSFIEDRFWVCFCRCY